MKLGHYVHKHLGNVQITQETLNENIIHNRNYVNVDTIKGIRIVDKNDILFVKEF